MKAISVKQPWANLIASGRKTIETRVWGTAYRGDLLVVSSRFPEIEPAGCAVAIVELSDCRLMAVGDEPAALCPVYPKAFAWILRNIRPIEPFRLRGQLRIYEVDVPPQSLIPLREPRRQTMLFESVPAPSAG